MSSKGIIHHPCLCESIKVVTFWGRLVGILPIVSGNPGNHKDGCTFNVSRAHLIFSCCMQVLYLAYILSMYVCRLACGPNRSLGVEWYVTSFGYFISDSHTFVTMVAGSLQAKRTCTILEKLSSVPGPVGEFRILEKILRRYMTILFPVYLSVLISHLYVGYRRLEYDFGGALFYCTMLDQPSGVVLRGFMAIIPTVEVGFIVMMGLLVCTKFRELAETTRLALENCQTRLQRTSDSIHSLESLPENHETIFSCVEDVNKCVGLQLLVSMSSSLYTMIYYLFRYSTSGEDGMTNNIHDRIHYVIGLTYRVGKLVVYMVLGQKVRSCSLMPLHTLQQGKVLNLPVKLQQQVQLLLMQWSGKKGSLSALNVVNLGPWLLAPIIGNVATYLLVVLQFRTTTCSRTAINATKKFESIF